MPAFRFRYIPYPLWRRRWPVPGVQFALRQLCRPFYPAGDAPADGALPGPLAAAG
ncbi:MAG TPA: hypothetical protein VKY59_13430 [Spirillospora sp.]|nr:hypothetical protein [Spirillospora sp.]